MQLYMWMHTRTKKKLRVCVLGYPICIMISGVSSLHVQVRGWLNLGSSSSFIKAQVLNVDWTKLGTCRLDLPNLFIALNYSHILLDRQLWIILTSQLDGISSQKLLNTHSILLASNYIANLLVYCFFFGKTARGIILFWQYAANLHNPWQEWHLARPCSSWSHYVVMLKNKIDIPCEMNTFDVEFGSFICFF